MELNTARPQDAWLQLSVVIPVYNEADNLAHLYERLQKTLAAHYTGYEIIFVNDGSTDTSMAEILKLAALDPSVRYIDLSRNFGHQCAIAAGLRFCVGKAVVVMDADLQDPPELIGEMQQRMNEGWDVVYARRRQRKGESWMKIMTARLFYRLLSSITSIKIPHDTGDFRMMTRKVVRALNQMPEHHKFVRGLVAWVGFRQTYVWYQRAARRNGKSSYSYRKMWRLAVDAITGFSTVPLKLATYLGFFISTIAFMLILYTLYARFFTTNYVQGWASIMISVLFIGGVQLICMGLIGEYLARMDANIRQRPPYIIHDTNIEPV